jgi:hypothetical protein
MKELNRIQKELKAPKNQYNSFGKYKYRNAEDILEAYKKIAGETTIRLSDEIVNVGDRYYIKATAILSEPDGETTVTAFAREAESKKGMDESQITGSASSYARKYALNGLFAIDDTKDADNNDNSNAQIEQHQNTIAKIESVEELKAYWEKNKGLGKEFSEMITARKAELEEIN